MITQMESFFIAASKPLLLQPAQTSIFYKIHNLVSLLIHQQELRSILNIQCNKEPPNKIICYGV